MLRRAVFLLMLHLLAVTPTLAHGGHEHVGDWQMIINGLGVIIIVIAGAASIIFKKE